MYSYQQCWFYQCPNPHCNCVGITNNVVLEHRCPDGVVQCPRCTQRMERIREALPGEYDPDDQEELARWATAFKVTFLPPWEVDSYLSAQTRELNRLHQGMKLSENKPGQDAITPFAAGSAPAQIAETAFLAEEDAARILGITAKAVRQLVKADKLRSIRLTKRKQVFTRALIEEFLQREAGLNKVTPGGQGPDPRSFSPQNNPIPLEESRSLLKDLRRDMSPPDADERPIHMSRRT